MRWSILISPTRAQEIQDAGIDYRRVLIDESVVCVRDDFCLSVRQVRAQLGEN
jgi:hypothetical protein